MMMTTSLDRQAPRAESLPVSLRHGARLRFVLLAAIPFCAALLCSAQAHAQDAAEAARQARARKEAHQKNPAHVYTNDDLSRARILTPQDRAEAEARLKNAAPLAQPDQTAPPRGFDAQAIPPRPSLGDVARSYRKQKEQQREQQASRYHLPANSPPLAISVQPSRPLLYVPFAKRRRSPFARPMLISPSRLPEVRPENLAPAAASAPAIPPEPVRAVAPIVTRNVRVAPERDLSPKSFAVKEPSRAVFSATPVAAPRFSSSPAPARKILAAHPEAIAPRPAPLAAAPMVAPLGAVVVQPGDSLWKMAERLLGSGNRWKEFLTVNPAIADPNRILPGARLVVPAASAVSAPGSQSTITVRHGDTLWGLARAHFGHGAAWTCLARANPSLRNPNLLLVGRTLALPGTCSSLP